MKFVAQIRLKAFHAVAAMTLALVGAAPARAQLTVGDNLSMRMNGTLGYGYSAGFGNEENSSHANTFVGDGMLNGTYYNPKFLTFQVRPFWDRAQNNSGQQTINRDSGIDAMTSLFSGSFFPGFVSYSNSFSSNGQTGFAGGGDIRTSGQGRSFGIGWSELIPGLPPVYANFSTGSSSFNELGSDATNETQQNIFNMGSSYQLFGFNLSGSYNHENWNYDYADLLGLSSTSSGSSSGLSVGAQHSLPLHGSLGLSWGHNSFSSEGGGAREGSSNTETATASIRPLSRLSFGGQIQHTTNLAAALSRLWLGDGGYTDIKSDDQSSSLSMGASASLAVGRGINTSGFVTQSTVNFAGREMSTIQYGGNVNYHFQHGFLKMFRFSVGMTDTANKEGNTGAAMVGSVGMDHKFHGWDVSADYNYTQNMQTLYGMSVASQHSYGSSVRRRLNESTFFSASFRGAHSGITGQEGNGSHTEAFSSNFSVARYTVGASYTRSTGASVFSIAGLSNPITGIGLITDNFVYSDSHSYSVAGSAKLLRKFVFTGAYTKSHSAVQSPLDDATNSNSAYFGQLDWRLRKMSFSAGFTHTQQDATSIRTGPYLLNSIYVRFSRWFNVF